jgi:hypothetical protein
MNGALYKVLNEDGSAIYAARAAEREWQTARLMEYLRGERT